MAYPPILQYYKFMVLFSLAERIFYLIGRATIVFEKRAYPLDSLDERVCYLWSRRIEIGWPMNRCLFHGWRGYFAYKKPKAQPTAIYWLCPFNRPLIIPLLSDPFNLGLNKEFYQPSIWFFLFQYR
jgi:hypothetical protein